MKFTLTNEQLTRIREWSVEQDKVVIAQQRERKDNNAFLASLNNDGIAYYGAIGGELTYSFTPNSLGEVVIVTHAVTKAELDVSDYNW